MNIEPQYLIIPIVLVCFIIGFTVDLWADSSVTSPRSAKHRLKIWESFRVEAFEKAKRLGIKPEMFHGEPIVGVDWYDANYSNPKIVVIVYTSPTELKHRIVSLEDLRTNKDWTMDKLLGHEKRQHERIKQEERIEACRKAGRAPALMDGEL